MAEPSLWDTALPLLAMGGGLASGLRNYNSGPMLFNMGATGANFARQAQYQSDLEKQREIDNYMGLVQQGMKVGDVNVVQQGIAGLQQRGFDASSLLPAAQQHSQTLQQNSALVNQMLGGTPLAGQAPSKAPAQPVAQPQAPSPLPAMPPSAPAMSGMDLSNLYGQIHDLDQQMGTADPRRAQAIEQMNQLTQKLPAATFPPYPVAKDQQAADAAMARMEKGRGGAPPTSAPAPDTASALPQSPTAPKSYPPLPAIPTGDISMNLPLPGGDTATVSVKGETEMKKRQLVISERIGQLMDQQMAPTLEALQQNPRLGLNPTQPLIDRRQLRLDMQQAGIPISTETMKMVDERLEVGFNLAYPIVARQIIAQGGGPGWENEAVATTGRLLGYIPKEFSKVGKITPADVNNTKLLEASTMPGSDPYAAEEALAQKEIQRKGMETTETTRARILEERQRSADIPKTAIPELINLAQRVVNEAEADPGYWTVGKTNFDKWFGTWAHTPAGKAAATYDQQRAMFSPLLATALFAQKGNLTEIEQRKAEDGLPPSALALLDSAEYNERMRIIEKIIRLDLRDEKFTLPRIHPRSEKYRLPATPSVTPPFSSPQRNLQQELGAMEPR